MPFKIFPILDQALIERENKPARASKTPRVWPSEASAALFDTRESNTIGRCHRSSYWRLIGEPKTSKPKPEMARRWVTGRIMEDEVTKLAQASGIFVASGVRFHVADIDLPLELDLVVIDPETGLLCIAENKTIYGYWQTKKVIQEGTPKTENVMQALIYLNEFGTVAALKAAIKASWDEKQALYEKLKAMMDVPGFVPDGAFNAIKEKYDRNRIDVDWDKLALAVDGPTQAKLTYETRDSCETKEFDIGIYMNSEDGLHYPTVDGIPLKLFCLESIYDRYAVLQGYHRRNIDYCKQQLAAKGVREPEDDYTEERHYWDQVFEMVRALPPKFWPPAEYEFAYSDAKIEMLGEAGILGKTKYQKWVKAKIKERIGSFNCNYCDHKLKCVAAEHPNLAHLVADVLEEEAA